MRGAGRGISVSAVRGGPACSIVATINRGLLYTCLQRRSASVGPRHTQQVPCAVARVLISFIAVIRPCVCISTSHVIYLNTQFFINYTLIKLEKKQNKTIFKREKKALCRKRLLGSRVSQDDTHGRARSRRQGAELTHSLLLSEGIAQPRFTTGSWSL